MSQRLSLTINNIEAAAMLQENHVPYKIIDGMIVSVRLIMKETEDEFVWRHVNSEMIIEMKKTFEEIYNEAFDADSAHGYEMIDLWDIISKNPALTKMKAKKYKSKENVHSIYIVSNHERINGSTAILHNDFMKKVIDKIGEEIIIIPLNTHCIYCMSKNVPDSMLDRYKLMLLNPEKADKELKTEIMFMKRGEV